MEVAVWKGMPHNERVLCLLDLAMKAEFAKEGRVVKGLDVYVDYSQDILRRPWSRGYVRSLTTSSCLYNSFLDRRVEAREHFALLGFPHTPLALHRS